MARRYGVFEEIRRYEDVKDLLCIPSLTIANCLGNQAPMVNPLWPMTEPTVDVNVGSIQYDFVMSWRIRM